MKYPILVIIPTLNRPDSVSDCVASFLKNSSGLCDVITVCRQVQPGPWAACNSLPPELLSQYEIIGLMNDDVRMRTKDWDKIVLAKLHGKTGMVYGRDGIQDQRLSTQPFFSAHVALDIGLVAPPPPKRNLCDNFWWEIFHAINRVEYVPELFTEHLHYSAGKSAYDETYQSTQQFFSQELADWPRFVSQEIPKLAAKIKLR